MSNQHMVYPNVDTALPDLMHRVLTGDEVGSRNGRVMEVTHASIALKHPWQREITLPGRKANIAAQIAETMWVLAGRNDIGFLSHYLPRAADFSDDGETWRGGYGPRIRAWDKGEEFDPRNHRNVTIDQLAHVVDLLKRDVLTRRAVIAIYDPAVDTADGKDIPCNDFIVFTNRKGSVDMAVTIRSNDLMWGWSGINAFEWSALHEIVAALVGVKQGTLHFNIASLHLYQQHWVKAQRLLGAERVIFSLADSPRFAPGHHRDDTAHQRIARLDNLITDWFRLEEIIRSSGDPMTNAVDTFPEPMMRSWLRVIQWWWTGDHSYLKPLAGTRLEYATHEALQPPTRTHQTDTGFGVAEVITRPLREGSPCPKCGAVMSTSGGRSALKCIAAVCNYTPSTDDVSPFMREVVALHTEKEAAYGGSWKRRGEVLGILANIARKVDRLGGGETTDETTTDTAVDLMVYLVKYAAWLQDQKDGTSLSDGSGGVNDMLLGLDRSLSQYQMGNSTGEEAAALAQGFAKLEDMVLGDGITTNPEKLWLVDAMARGAYLLARTLWRADQDPTKHVDPAYRGADAD